MSLVTQQSATHAPVHQSLHRPEPQFALDAVDGVLSGHRLDCPRLLYSGVGHVLGEGDENLPLPRSQPGLGLGARGGERSAFLSEGHLTFPWQGKGLPGIGQLVIVEAKKIREYEVTHDECNRT